MLAYFFLALVLLPWGEPVRPTLALASEVHEGTVIMAGEGKLTLRDKDGENELFTLAEGAKITLNGQDAKLEELKQGDKARVTAQRKGDKLTATLIEARSGR